MIISERNDIEAISTKKELVNKAYSYWRMRLLIALIIGYSTLYITRQNFAMAIPSMTANLGYTNGQIGWIITAFSIVYGISKFLSGSICDRTNARYFMTIALIGAGIVNIGIGLSNSLFLIGFLYACNGWFQSMGWPSCTRILTHWYSSEQLGTRWGICNSSHQIGSVVILIAGGYLVSAFSWRDVFILPGIMTLLIAAMMFTLLRDTPQSLGLPPVDGNKDKDCLDSEQACEDNITFKKIFLDHILPNKPLWFTCVGNFFLYIVRMGFFFWGPKFLIETRGIELVKAGGQTAVFEMAGLIGGIIAGWLSDRLFRGRRGAVCCLFMLALAVSIAIFCKLPVSSMVAGNVLMFVMGFLVYGPQVLAGVAAAEFGSKKAACTANGLTGTFGYLGAAFCGPGIGYAADILGWNMTFLALSGLAFIGALCFVPVWNKTEQSHA